MLITDHWRLRNQVLAALHMTKCEIINIYRDGCPMLANIDDLKTVKTSTNDNKDGLIMSQRIKSMQDNASV